MPRDHVPRTTDEAEQPKQVAKRIFRQTLAAIDISAALRRALARKGSYIQAGGVTVDLRAYREIVCIAFGKAALAMAQGLKEILEPDYETNGILVLPGELSPALPEWAGWSIFAGGHPVPNEGSFRAGRAILDRLARCDEHTLIFFLISGGGSSLVEQPLRHAWTLADFQKLHAALVTCGGTIQEINVVRKHLSATKGGRLAAAAPLSLKLTYAISDVPSGEESSLASGPTLPDPSTVRDASKIATKYCLWEKLPLSMRAGLEARALAETPKEGNSAFARSSFVTLLGERELLHAAHRACEAEGYVTICDYATDGWTIDRASDHLLAILRAQGKAASGKAVSVVAGGEVTSPVTGYGIGGRNSAFVLGCVPKIAGERIIILSVGTDGIDGNSVGAGAIADGETLARAQGVGLNPEEFLRRSDAYTFFSRLGDEIVTGATGNNLRDLRILLMEK
jgi:glycerate 2-kinase